MADAVAQAAEWKAKGNAALGQQKFDEAIDCYTKVSVQRQLGASAACVEAKSATSHLLSLPCNG